MKLPVILYSSIWLLCIMCTRVYSQYSFRYDVKNGIDVLIEKNFESFQNKKIAFVTNQSGRTRTLHSSLDIFIASKTCKVVSILTPEHGFYGMYRAGELIHDSTLTLYGIPLFSLYGSTRRPTLSMLQSSDEVVLDLQDVGIRSYTFLSTVYNVMDACAEFGKPLTILDRPNPLGGKIIDGNSLDTAFASFVGVIPIPYIHGCTLGELAQIINQEGWLPRDSLGVRRKCSLNVIKAEGWQRWMTWEDTDFHWIPTSPHIPTVHALRGMAVIGLLGELSILNVGIGYTTPFQLLGSPTLQPELIFEALRRTNTPGISLISTQYRPFYQKFRDTSCHGIFLSFTPDASKFRPFSAGIELLLAIRSVHPELFFLQSIPYSNRSMFIKVSGTDKIFDMLFLKKSPDEEIRRFIQKGIKEFSELRKKYLLYD